MKILTRRRNGAKSEPSVRRVFRCAVAPLREKMFLF